MRSRNQFTISPRRVHEEAAPIMREHLQIRDHGWKCRASVLISILYFAAARVASIYDACQRLRYAPSDEAVRQALIAMCPSMAEMERRVNAALSCRMLQRLRRRPQRLAIDFTEIPYHGKPHQDPREIRTGRPKYGTTRFHTYATVYVVQHGQRLTLAMTYVWGDDTVRNVVQRLLRRVRELGVSVRYLLLDREFYSLEVVQYLKAAHYAFLMPVVHRGRRAKDPSRAQGTQRFLTWKRSGFSEHRLRNRGRTARVQIAVACVSRTRRGSRRKRRLVYAFWGFQPPNCRWVREEYRRRFSIETSYRQMNQGRIRTCARNPVLRLLLVAIALILRNLWIWLHRELLAVRLPNGKLDLNEHQMRLRTMTLCLERYAEALLQCTEYIEPKLLLSKDL
jgi:putative transposase